MVLTNQAPEPDASSHLIRQEVARQAVGLISTPDRVLPEDTATTLLRREPVLLPAPETSIRPDFEAYSEHHGVMPRTVAEVDDMAMLLVLTREGHAIAVVPPIVAKDELDSGELTLAAELPCIIEAFYAITLRRRFLNNLVQSLMSPT